MYLLTDLSIILPPMEMLLKSFDASMGKNSKLISGSGGIMYKLALADNTMLLITQSKAHFKNLSKSFCLLGGAFLPPFQATLRSEKCSLGLSLAKTAPGLSSSQAYQKHCLLPGTAANKLTFSL